MHASIQKYRCIKPNEWYLIYLSFLLLPILPAAPFPSQKKKLYTPGLEERVKEPYSMLICPKLARSKITLEYAGQEYIDHRHDVSMWSRPPAL